MYIFIQTILLLLLLLLLIKSIENLFELFVHTCVQEKMNAAAMNRTVGREELQYIIANITEHNLEDEASFYSFGLILAVSLISLTIG